MLKLRHAAVILTPAGIVTVRDKNDMYIRKTIDIIENEPDKTDEQKAAAVEIVKQGKYSLPGGGPEPFEQDPCDTIIREVSEELNLHVEARNMQKLAEIVGNTRRHVIYLVRATGMISLNPDESITGIGFLKPKNVFPLIHTFFQTHVMRLHSRYYHDSQREEREARLIQFVSNIRVSEILIKEWFEEEKRAEIYRGKNHRHSPPRMIDSSPNLTILGVNGQPLPSLQTSSLTKASAAVFIPRSPENTPGIAKAQKKPSDPAMRAIRPPSTPPTKMKDAKDRSGDEVPDNLPSTENGGVKPAEESSEKKIEVEDFPTAEEKISGQK